MSRKKIFKNSVYVLSFIAVLMVAVLCFYPGEVASAVAVPSFESSAVLDDLEGMTIDGKVFNTADYPKDPYGKISAVTFMEYCFSQYENKMGNYGLYIYVHNPALTKIDDTHVLNKITMAIEFNEKDMPSKYKKFSLKFCSKSSDGQFYKFKIIDPTNEIIGVIRDYAVTHRGERCYYVSEVELVKIGQYNATAYNVGRQYVYEGFAKGYGDSENFPLQMNSLGIKTIQTDLNYAFYRPEGATEAYGHTQAQLNSVYFSIPNEFLKVYGLLAAVYMEWYEYLTKDIFVFSDNAALEKLRSYVGRKINSYDSDVYYGLYADLLGVISSGKLTARTIYNNPTPESFNIDPETTDVIVTLYYLFDLKQLTDSTVSSETLLNYIQAYSGSGDKLNGKYYKELFEDYVEEGRTYGYNDFVVHPDDNLSLLNYTFSSKWWQLGWGTHTDNSYKNIKGIVEVKSEDMSGTPSSICQKFFIDDSCYNDFKKAFDKAEGENSTLFLLRFGVTNYTSYSLKVVQPKKDWTGSDFYEDVDTSGYCARQTAFIDLDIIDVTFKDEEGVKTVIPVCASPIDGIGSLTKPIDYSGGTKDWKKIIGIILGIVILIILLIMFWPILQPFLSVLWHILSLPLYLIAGIFKAIKNKSKRE